MKLSNAFTRGSKIVKNLRGAKQRSCVTVSAFQLSQQVVPREEAHTGHLHRVEQGHSKIAQSMSATVSGR